MNLDRKFMKSPFHSILELINNQQLDKFSSAKFILQHYIHYIVQNENKETENERKSMEIYKLSKI